MCVVSAIGDNWGKTVPDRWPWTYPYLPHPNTTPWIWPPNPPEPGSFQNVPTQEDFDALRREVLELRELLIAAKKFDEATGQQDCEQAEKVALIKQLAEFVGVDLEDVLDSEVE